MDEQTFQYITITLSSFIAFTVITTIIVLVRLSNHVKKNYNNDTSRS